MKRWHEELPMMLSRWRKELRKHGWPRLEVGWHCGRGPGVARKVRPYACNKVRCCFCHPEKYALRKNRGNKFREWLRYEETAEGFE